MGMSNKKFRNCLIEFDKLKTNLEKEKREFVFDVQTFMRERGIPVRVLFFGDTFGLDIDLNVKN